MSADIEINIFFSPYVTEFLSEKLLQHSFFFETEVPYTLPWQVLQMTYPRSADFR